MNEDYKRWHGVLTLALAAFGLLQAWLLLAPGALLMSQMEADVYHILDAAFRIRDNEVQHVDFSTPLGVLAFNAVGLPMKFGLAPGASMAWANICVMILMIPATLWLHATRMPFGAALGLGLAAMLIATTLTWGGGGLTASFAMFYNRWGWAMLVVLLPVFLVPPRSQRDDWVDGLIIGLVAAALFYLKITYAVGLAMVGLVWMLSARRWRATGVALAVCLVASALITASFGGMEMLGGYMDDMADVSANTVRQQPGLGFIEVVSRAEVAAITITLFAAMVVLFRAGMGRLVLVWAAAAGAIYYIAFQNFGNWPTGAIAAPFILWALGRQAPEHARAFGAPVARVMGVLAVGLLFSFAPTFALMESGLVANVRAHPSTSSAILAEYGAPDLVFLDEGGRFFGLDRVGEGAEEDPQRRTFAGVDFPPCAFGQGVEAIYPQLAEDMRGALNLAGKRILLADTINPMWFLTGTQPLHGVHIWYYVPFGEKLDQVDFFVAPFCALTRPQRNAIIDEVAASGLQFTLALRTPHFAVFERQR